MKPTDMLAGQAALVTGGASGIGRAIAQLLADSGATVMIADRNADAAETAAEAIRANGGNAASIALDVSISSQVDSAVGATVARFGGLHILVTSAGVGAELPFLDTSDEDWRRILDINLSGTFFCMRAAGRVMAAAGYGRIVTLSSTAGLRGGTGRGAYGATKGGVMTLTKVLAVELAETGVTVNALAPGAIETELVSRMHSAATRRNYRAAIPMDRYGTPEEVAQAALFLASPAAGYVTGQVLGVDGGFLAAGVMNRPRTPD